MASWKLGTGSSYAGITGFTWPTDLNPQFLDRAIQKLKLTKPIPLQDSPLMIDQGTQAIPVAIEGVFYAESDFNSLAAYAAQTSVDSSGVPINLIQRLYISGTDYIFVRNGVLKRNLLSTNPLGFPYVLNFDGQDPFVYTDGVNSYASASGTSARTATGIANSGNAYIFPYFSLQNNGVGSITAITITYGSLSLTWSGTLPAGSTLFIYQQILESSGLYGPHAYIGAVETGQVGGSRFVLQANVSGQSMSCSWTGGTTGIFTVYSVTRRWG